MSIELLVYLHSSIATVHVPTVVTRVQYDSFWLYQYCCCLIIFLQLLVSHEKWLCSQLDDLLIGCTSWDIPAQRHPVPSNCPTPRVISSWEPKMYSCPGSLFDSADVFNEYSLVRINPKLALTSQID